MGSDIPDGGHAGATFKQDGADAAASITTANLVDGTAYCQGILVSANTQNLRIAFGGTSPDQTNVGHLLSASQPPIYIRSWGVAKTLKFINAANGVQGFLQVTPIF